MINLYNKTLIFNLSISLTDGDITAILQVTTRNVSLLKKCHDLLLKTAFFYHHSIMIIYSIMSIFVRNLLNDFMAFLTERSQIPEIEWSLASIDKAPLYRVLSGLLLSMVVSSHLPSLLHLRSLTIIVLL